MKNLQLHPAVHNNHKIAQARFDNDLLIQKIKKTLEYRNTENQCFIKIIYKRNIRNSADIQ